jgi:hypothetical protein
MLLLRALLLWSFISLHVIGGAVVFRRFFPRESPWFGFIVPLLGFVLLLNFIERMEALPSLLWLLPFTTIGFIWVLLHPRPTWRGLGLPTGVFLAAFAFTLMLRGLHPDIPTMRDGVVDLSLLASFLQGEKVPPHLIWYAPVILSHYYVFGHYAMSVLTRLFGVDVGTGFNLSSALLGALNCVLAAGTAWRVGGQKIWITILAPILMECAATGATAYLWLTTPRLDPNDAGNLLGSVDQNLVPLLKWLHPGFWYDRRELVAPGAWSWIGSFHSTSVGQFLIFFFGFSLVEILRRRPSSNWPWICMGAIPFFSIVTSSWAVLLEVPVLLGTFFFVWREKISPRNLRFVLLCLGGVIVLLLPGILEYLSTSAYPGGNWTHPEGRTQLLEFLVLWWPVYLPWLALIFIWPQLSSALKTLIIVLPLALLGMEFYTIAGRPDWTSKLWGYIYGLGWIVFFPAICARRGFFFRGLVGLLVISGALSFVAWSEYTCRLINWTNGDILHLEGTNFFRMDPLRSGLLPILSQMKGQTLITSRSYEMYCKSPALAAFTGNRVYVTWSYFSDTVAGADTGQGAVRREKEVNDLYDGKCENPLLFLRTHDIAAVVIYTADNIPGSVIDQLKKQLAPYYEYTDFSTAPVHSGIFVYHPELMSWPAAIPAPISR